jgi:cytochrome c2
MKIPTPRVNRCRCVVCRFSRTHSGRRLHWLTTAFVCCLTLVGAAGARAGDVENGKVVFEKCTACHSLEAGHDEEGPSLAGIFGRKAASVKGYRYSAAMKRSDVVWADDTLDAFIQDPQAFIAGNRMPFDGLKDKGERDDLLAYLKQATAPASATQIRQTARPDSRRTADGGQPRARGARRIRTS